MIVERGDTGCPPCRYKVWMKSMGRTESRGEKKMPPLTKEFWEQCLDEVGVDDDSMVSLHTDGGENHSSAYAVCSRERPGIEQHQTVCHGQKNVFAKLPRPRQEERRWVVDVAVVHNWRPEGREHMERTQKIDSRRFACERRSTARAPPSVRTVEARLVWH